MRTCKLASAVLIAVLVSACTTSGEKGNPTPASTPGSSSGNSAGSNLPARPSSLKLDSVDACKLLNADQMKQLQAVATNPTTLDLVDGAKSPSCHYNGEDSFAYTIGAVTHN